MCCKHTKPCRWQKIYLRCVVFCCNVVVHARTGRAGRAYWTTVTSSIRGKKNYSLPIKHKFPQVPNPPVRCSIHCSPSPFIRLKNIGWSNEILKASCFVLLKIKLWKGGKKKTLSAQFKSGTLLTDSSISRMIPCATFLQSDNPERIRVKVKPQKGVTPGFSPLDRWIFHQSWMLWLSQHHMKYGTNWQTRQMTLYH